MNWLADKIERWPTERLLPYIRNPRTHSDEQIAQIAASIAEFGFVKDYTGRQAVLESTGQSFDEVAAARA